MNNNTLCAKAVVIGAAGQLGCELLRPQAGCAPQPDVQVHGLDVDDVDITDPASIRAAVAPLAPRVIINAAAYTDVDGCESHVEQAQAVNAEGPGHLAAVCKQLGCRLIHISTDYVFDGRKNTPYRPDDPVNPMSVYGRTKADGEQRVRETLHDHLIVRTSWLFSSQGRNFVKTILHLAAQKHEIPVVTDQVGRPTFAKDLATALWSMALTDLTGTYHFANAGACTWNEFARQIVQNAGLPARIVPFATARLSRPAMRPMYSVLDTSSLTAHTGIEPRPWQLALAECMVQIQAKTQVDSQSNGVTPHVHAGKAP